MEGIPNEALIHVFSFFTRRRELALISLVCRHWNMLAFAGLYHTLYLGRQTDVESISDRILSETENETPLSVCRVLRRFIFDPIRYQGKGEAQSFPEEAISKLVHLEHLSWDFLEPPQSYIMLAFRDHCPDLRSLEIKVRHDIFAGDDNGDACNVGSDLT
ncbi:hypothetical protein BDV93DRAFT_332739 [Ceratobasidium sp. AG-I]|nr:hypothetical protein BDV93DRAFT_332739 [Ceratobasidium sp. AG-I]